MSYDFNSSRSYRYGFNKMEKDDEVSGEGNSYDFGARMYNPRLGRWLSVDPKAKKQPAWSPYKAFNDNPLVFVDPNGETEYQINITVDAKTGEAVMEIKTANSVMTDGKKHTVWSGQSSYHLENNYYDYATITVTTINGDAPPTVEKATTILYENGVKDADYVWFGGDSKGDTKTESWLTGEDHGQTVLFGIGMSGGGDGPVAQDRAKNVVGSIDFGDLKSILKRTSSSSGYSPGSGTWQKFDPKKAKDWLKFIKNRKDEGEHLVETGEAGIQEGKKIKDALTLDNKVKSDSCKVCGSTGTPKEMSEHSDVTKRKGYGKK